MANFLIVGLATDGPTNIIYSPTSLRDFNSIYGSNNIQRFSISPTATSVVLDYTPLKVDSTFLGAEKNYIYQPYFDNTGFYFGSVGGSGTNTLDVYYTPYTGSSDLGFAYKYFTANTGLNPYVCRIGGTTASCTCGGWDFYARYQGAKYNNLTITTTVSSITISGLEPLFQTISVSGSLSDIISQLDRKYRLGSSPVFLNNTTADLYSGTASLTGGTDGTFSFSEIQDFFLQSSIPIDVTHVLFLSPISSGCVTEVSKYINNGYSQPKMFFFPATNYTAPASTWLQSFMNEIPNVHNMIGVVLGDVEIAQNDIVFNRYAAEGIFCALANSTNKNLTNIPVNCLSYTPLLTETELQMLKDFGIISITRHIMNDLAVNEGVTLANDNSFVYSSKLCEIYALAYQVAFDYYGQVIFSSGLNKLESDIANVISNVAFFVLDNVRVTSSGSSLLVNINGTILDEILSIKFVIKNTL